MSFTSQTYDSEVTDIDIDPELFALSQTQDSRDPPAPVSIFELLKKPVPETVPVPVPQPKPQSPSQSSVASIPIHNDTKIRHTSSLMSILTGNKKTKKEPEPVPQPQSEPEPQPEPQPEPVPVLPETEAHIIEDDFELSVSDSKTLQLQREHDVRELERKMYKDNVKSVSAKDLFARLKKKDPPTPTPTPTPVAVEIIDIETTEPEITEISSTIDLEAKIYGNSKRTSARDIFKSFKSFKGQDKRSSSYFVTLKVNSQALKDIQKYSNPLITKGIHSGTGTGTGSSDFFTPPPKSASLFDSMMQASKKLSPLQKLRELEPLVISKDLMHIYCDDDLPRVHDFQTPWNLKHCLVTTEHEHEHEHSAMDSIFNSTVINTTKYQYKYSIDTQADISQLINDTIPNYEEEQALLSVVDRFITHKVLNNISQLWIDLFQPEKLTDLIMSQTNQNHIKHWINNSFIRLKNQNLKNPRNVLLKQRKRKDKLSNNFIIDDNLFYDDDEETDEDIFVPLLILEGSSGSGKSTSIYTAMKEIGGYVHEINSGVHRGRKDIYNSLKEFCTTQLVHQQKSQKEFQLGLVLLEDVDILFEQDKNFWQTVGDILNISRKPLVLTCESIQSIPKNILDYTLEDDSIIRINDNQVNPQLIQNYLWLCCLSQGYDIDNELIISIMNNSYNGINYDLRKCLMECQFMCEIHSPCETGIIHISPNDSESIEFNDDEDLISIANQIDCASAGDTISSNSFSVFNHRVVDNELPEICDIDETRYLRHPALPTELNIGNHLSTSLNLNLNNSNSNLDLDLSSPTPKFSYNYLRDIVVEFIGSRSKRLPKLMQDLQTTRRSLRSRNSPYDDRDTTSPEPISRISDTSFLNYITPNSLVVDLLPYCRYLSQFQLILDEKELEQLSQGYSSVKRFLNYRDFQINSPAIRKTFPQSLP
ncbi:uncharacterized protein RJT21DRAFT_382 [Scheffersomyces amazonensis]|uniref:uncharacterized protein n=1 Tax=Scheffersomyces amazonensis TaxID=1078765 RepID=UPI00315CE105